MKVVRNAVCLIIGWTVAWAPYAFVALMGISGYGHLLTVIIINLSILTWFRLKYGFIWFTKPLSATIPALFAKLTTCIEPFIYALNKPKIRQEIRRRYIGHANQPNRATINSNNTIISARSWMALNSQRLTATPSINIQQQWQTTSL